MNGTEEFQLPANSPILILDDDVASCERLASVLEEAGYPVRRHVSSVAALEEIRTFNPVLMLLSLDLRSDAGTKVARIALEADPTLAIVAISNAERPRPIVECFRIGVIDCLIRPWDPAELEAAVTKTLLRRAEELYRHGHDAYLRKQLAERGKRVREGTLDALRNVADTIEDKHPYLKGHGKSVADLSGAIARVVGLSADRVRDVWWAGRLHDLGMIAVPDQALQSEGVLTRDQTELIRAHPELGAKLLQSQQLESVAAFVRGHHERLDGSGYPDQAAGADIPIGAMIVGLAETFAALTERRPHREACSRREALDVLRGVEDAWFPRDLIRAMDVVERKKAS